MFITHIKEGMVCRCLCSRVDVYLTCVKEGHGMLMSVLEGRCVSHMCQGRAWYVDVSVKG